jgi:hypothetical protein
MYGDSNKWYFMKCIVKGNCCSSYRNSYLLHENKDMKDKAGHIIWLLEEAQKQIKAEEESREK